MATTTGYASGSDTPTVRDPTPRRRAQSDKVRLIRNLLAGAREMRSGCDAAGKPYLPMFTQEKKADYETRKSEAVLYNYVADAIDEYKERAFASEIETDGIPERLQPMLDRIDGTNTKLMAWAAEFFEDAVAAGMSLLRVEAPKIEGALNAADEDARGLPWFDFITLENILQDDRDESGDLSLLRILETCVERDGWEESAREKVRVYYAPGVESVGGRSGSADFVHYELFVPAPGKNGEEDWKNATVEDFGTMQPLKRIPVAEAYTGRDGKMAVEAPLEHMAELNLRHFRSYSEQMRVLKFDRIALSLLIGFPELAPKRGDEEKPLTKAPSNMLHTTETDSSAKVLESSGVGLEQGWKELELLEKQMERAAGDAFVDQPTSRTATESRQRGVRSRSRLQQWATEVAQAVTEGFRIAAEWMGVDAEIPELRFDLDPDVVSPALEFDALWKMATEQLPDGQTLLSRDSLIRELRRRRTLGPAFDEEQNAAELEVQPPSFRTPPGDFSAENDHTGQDGEDVQ